MIQLTLALMGCAHHPAPVTEATDWRYEMPAPLESETFKLPEWEEHTLSNGVKLLFVQDTSLPLFSVTFHFRVGMHTDPQGMEGLGRFTLDMMDEGAGERSALDLSEALVELSSSVGASGGWDGSSVYASGLTRNLDPTLELMSDVLHRPRFDEEDWSRLKRSYLQNLEAARSQPSVLQSKSLRTILFGEVYQGRFMTESTIEAVQLDDMRAWGEEHLVPANLQITASGDLEQEELVAKMEAMMAGWEDPGEAIEQPSFPLQPMPEEHTFHLVDKPKAAQSLIYAVREIPEELLEEGESFRMANLSWGGLFTARLNMNLREDKGYTYGARSGIIQGDLAPPRWRISTSVKTSTTKDSIVEILRELEEVSEVRPLTGEELASAISFSKKGFPSSFERPASILGRVVGNWKRWEDNERLLQYMERLDRVDFSQAQQRFAEEVASQPLHFIIVGDLEVIREDLEGLGYPVVLRDSEGQIITQGQEE